MLIDADLAAHTHLLRFVTRAERQRYRRNHCRLALAYLDKKTFAVDWGRIAAEHPGLYAPLCASVVQHGAGRAALAQARHPRRHLAGLGSRGRALTRIPRSRE